MSAADIGPVVAHVEDQAAGKAQALVKAKRLALAALMVALLGLVLAVSQGAHGGWAWLKAFCEAAAVGALADWFAVVALFRHPLGLPIPHTALIPQGKARIADSLAAFVRDHFMDPDYLLKKLQVFNPAQRLGEWLRAPEHTAQLTESVRTLLLEGLDLVNEEAVRLAVSNYVSNAARQWDASTTASNVVSLLTHDGRHHELLDAALSRVGEYLADPSTREAIATKMVAAVRREYPKITSVVDYLYSVEDMGSKLADKVARELVDEVQLAMSQPGHTVRARYEQFIYAFVDRLRNDEAFRAQVSQIKDKLADSPEVRAYVDGLFDEVRRAIEADLRRDDSTLLRHVSQGLAALGARLGDDPALAQAINDHVLSAAGKLVAQLREGVTAHIASTVKAWDEREFVMQLELNVGRDLQYIRLNGTLVGGLIGLGLHAALSWAP